MGETGLGVFIGNARSRTDSVAIELYHSKLSLAAIFKSLVPNTCPNGV